MNTYLLPIFIQTLIYTSKNITINVPQLEFLPNLKVQYYINRKIQKEVHHLFDLVNGQGYFKPGQTIYIGNYEIKNNQRGIVSLTLSNFANMQSMAHPVDHLTSLTTDVKTGGFYSFEDLFKPDSPYVERISEIVKLQINERNLPTFTEFESIRTDQDYYIADKSIVIYFQKYELGPRPLGYPMFPISIYSLEDIIDENGPLGKMIYQ